VTTCGERPRRPAAARTRFASIFAVYVLPDIYWPTDTYMSEPNRCHPQRDPRGDNDGEVTMSVLLVLLVL